MGEFDEQFLERATTLVPIFSHVQVVMEVGSSDKMERSQVLALALPRVLQVLEGKTLLSSISLMVKEKKHYLAHQVTPPTASRAKEERELTFVEHLLYAGG